MNDKVGNIEKRHVEVCVSRVLIIMNVYRIFSVSFAVRFVHLSYLLRLLRCQGLI